MSGGGPSSIKRSSLCAARVPVLSRRCEVRVGVNFDFGVYGLVLQSGAFSFREKALYFFAKKQKSVDFCGSLCYNYPIDLSERKG